MGINKVLTLFIWFWVVYFLIFDLSMIQKHKNTHTMTIQQHAEKFGARNTAQTLFRKRIESFGLFVDDLPDTFEVADIIDCLEEAIGDNNREEVRSILSEITIEWVGELIMS